MSKYDYAKRLKQLVRREKALIRRECALAKSSFRFLDNFEKLEERYCTQYKELQQFHHRVQAVRDHVQEQEQLQTEAEKRLRQINEKLQCARQRIVDRTEEQEQLLDKIRSLKEATSTYINLAMLSQGTVQGVTLLETANNSEWRPFRLDTVQHTPEQLKQLIWGDAPQAAAYSDAWEELVFRAMRAATQRQAAKQDLI